MEVVPPGGFRYAVNGEIAEGHNRASLIEALQNFRIQNNLDIGDPEADVDRELVKRSKAYHPPISAGSLEERPQPQKTFIDRVRDWLSNLTAMRHLARERGAGLEYVSTTEANRRALICYRCPQNKEWRTNCSPCVAEIENMIVNLGQNRQTQAHDHLMGCAITNHENRVAVWLQKQHLPKRNLKTVRQAMPSFCWLRSL